MSDNSESTFQPHSDEELALLLEEQMRAMRAAQPITAPQPVASTSVFRETEVVQEVEEELGIDDLFGALLDDTTEVAVVEQIVAEEIFIPTVDESSLAHTQPFSYIQEDVVEVAVIDDHVIVEETIVEEVIEDAHIIAERVLSEISIDGEIVATAISETAGADPIPQMFGEAQVISAVEAETVLSAAQMSFTPEVEEIFIEVSEEIVEVESVIEETVQESAPELRMTNPINSFAPRPTFDELVFGVKSDD